MLLRYSIPRRTVPYCRSIKRMRNFRTKITHIHCGMHCGLLCCSTVQLRLGFFMQGCIFSLSHPKNFVQINGIIPKSPVASRSVHTLPLESLAGSADPERKQWPYFVGGPHSPHHSATSGFFGYFFRTIACQAKTHFAPNTTAICLQLLIRWA